MFTAVKVNRPRRRLSGCSASYLTCSHSRRRPLLGERGTVWRTIHLKLLDLVIVHVGCTCIVISLPVVVTYFLDERR